MIIDLSDECVAETRQVNSFPYKKQNLPSKTGHDGALTSIFLALEDVVLRSRFYVHCEWTYLDSATFREPSVSFKSFLHSDRNYDFIIRFPMDFPSNPPRILPLHSLPCLPFVVISNHPVLSKEYWSFTQSLSEIFETIVTYMESLSYDYESSLKHEDHLFLDNTSPGVSVPFTAERSIESMISDLYGMFRFEVKGYPELEDVVLRLYPPDFCKILGSTSSSSSSSNKNGKKGVGYSTDGHSGSGKSQHASSKGVTKSKSEHLLDEIADKLKGFTTQKGWSKWLTSSSSSSSSTSTISQSLAEWILASPLVDTISFTLSGFSREEMFRHSTEVSTIFTIIYKIEQITTNFQKEIEKTPSKSFKRLESVNHLLTLAYQRLYTVIDDDIFSSRAAWLKEIQKSSRTYQEVIQASKTVSLDTEKEKTACSSSSSSPSSRKLSQRVYHLPNIEAKHYFYQQSGSSLVKCSKSWMRELSFIEENLPDEITLFVSEDHPNYFVCCMHVLNTDCPYYGGSYFFHILIPASYPSTSPKVQFMTTGEGTVRFNPNLYNCGKVCLSLLGTWAG
jgi:ubiquitin-protein ligase